MADNDARIEELLARWQAEPGSRVFVQLADEYRKAGKLNEALKVLEAGLKRQPNYLSAKIALGRCRLEKGEAEAAIVIFQEVLRRDATNLVANKLLAEAYLDAGQLDKAREQVRLYSILNDRDPEAQQLMRWIDAGGKPEPEVEMMDSPLVDAVQPEVEIEAEPAVEVEAVVETEAVAEAEPVVGAEAVAEVEFSVEPPAADQGAAFDLEMETPAAQTPEPKAEPESAAGPLPETAPPPPTPPMDGDVFGDLFGKDDQERYLSSLGSEGLFTTEVESASPPPVPSPGASEIVAAEEVPAPAEEPAVAVPMAVEPLPAGSVDEVQGLEQDAPAAPTPPPLETPAATRTAEVEEAHSGVAASEDIFGGLANSGTTGVSVDDAEPVFNLPAVAPGTTSVQAPHAAAHPQASQVEESEEQGSEPAPVEDVAATMFIPQLAAAAEEEEPPATATLGQLYLQQGHREEARKIFRRVLERDPAHPVALAALQAMDKEQPPATSAPPPAPGADGGVTAAELLQGSDADGLGLTARKTLLLNNYLQRLRAGEQGA